MRLASQLKTVSKETLIYGAGNAAGSIVSFVLLPLYTKFLSPTDYGYLAVFAVFQSVIEITAAFGLSSGLFRYYLMAENRDEQKKVLSTCFWTQIAFIIFVSVLIFPFSKYLSVFFIGNANFTLFFTLVSATGLLSSFGGFVFSYMRAERKPILFSIFQLGKLVLLTIVNIYFVAVLHKSYGGIIVGNFGVTTLVTLVLVIWFLRVVHFSFSFSFFKRLIVFIGPIFVVNAFFFILSLSDRFFLNHFLTPNEVGLYSFGNKLGSIVMVGVITPFSTAIVPYAMSIAKESHFKATFAKIIKYFLLVLVYLSLIIFLFSKEIVLLVSNTSYIRASEIIGPILLSSIFYGLYYNLSIAIDIVEKTYLASIVVITGALISGCINYFFIPICGIYGSALASSVSNGVLCGFMYYYCQKYFPISYEINAFIRLIGIVFLFILIYFFMKFLMLDTIWIFLVKILLCVLFPVLLYIFNVFDKREKYYILDIFKKR